MDAVEQTSGHAIRSRRVPRALVKIAAALAPVYYGIARKKPVLSKYSVDVLMSNSNISCGKAQEQLGYRPRPLMRTIRDMVRWHRAARAQKV